MTAGDAGTWLQAAAAVVAVLITAATWMFTTLLREVRDARAESVAAGNHLHQRLDGLPAVVVSRREYEATIKSLEHAITELTRQVQHLGDQLDKMQNDTASGRVELMAHQVDCPARGKFPG
jgi:uncharacterized protein HemX